MTADLSPAARELLHLAQHPRFDRITASVEAVRGCTRPIQLFGHATTHDAATGEVLHHFDTRDEPFGRLLVPCGNRRESRCPSCSRLYSADTFHLIRAGLAGGKNVPDTVTTHPRVFATLTAPSFGPVHNQPTTRSGKRRPCACGIHHLDTDPAIGIPITPAAYDYAGAVLFNAHAGMLWARFTTYLRRAVAKAAGLKVKELPDHARLSFAKVAEFQKRGLVHFHAIVRIDGPDGPTTTPPTWATTELLDAAIREAHERTALTVISNRVGEREMRWGAQLDVRPITTSGAHDDRELTEQAVAAYVAKYATKSAESSGTVDRSLHCNPCNGRGHVADPAGHVRQCKHCHGTGQAEPIRDLRVATHVRAMIRTCWDLGALPEFADLKLWKWAHMLGFKGHFSTKSRRYSTTLGQLRDARRSWRAETNRSHHGLPPIDETTTLVVSSWQFLGTGYTPAEQLIADTVRHNLAVLQQHKREGGETA
ncbi:zinc finger-like domain-containing protein [Streptacidiphilus melanogenes]|uniref:zinc finger-like domain-containing protein n=1 Tax=Streptacidiphilus melanogenes TaxID=411235 RepID=UPI0005A7BD83|nr:zinc finger-like domain-containing protein [Streptacidiphilus melanogenes]